jgi:hypothetical protein
MSTTTSPKPTIAFFGATGGCAHACLVHTLQAGHTVSALARTPSKLTAQLLADGVPQETLDAHLVITQGDSKDVAAVKKTLCPLEDGAVVSKIISGIGGTVKVGLNPLRPFPLTDPTICEQSALTLVQALRDLQAAYKGSAKPLVAVVSTTGIARAGKPRDVPVAFLLLYHWLLAKVHVDKKGLEKVILENAGEEGVFRSFVGVRASLLTGGTTAKGGKGLERVRAGTEDRPAVGYTISRADVGEWIFENVVRKEGEGWLGEFVAITT